MTERIRILILGGTGEARRLAARLARDARFDIETSLAGVTAEPVQPAGRIRRGGFGGTPGLTAHLRAEAFDLVVDATHPFADTISGHAAAAADAAGCARVVLHRPAWRQQDGDRWIEAADVGDAARKAPTFGQRIFLSIGRQEVGAFVGCPGLWFLVRHIDPPTRPIALRNHLAVSARGPFERDAEIALMQQHRIDLVVSKNSGGADTYAKIEAARALGLPVVMIRRPPPPPGEIVPSVEAALDWIDARYP